MKPQVLKESEFDPYYKWLGIPPQHQPADHYRLLGLEIFESDRDVIRAAAERQAAHIQSYKIGPQSDLSQRLLNEISKAKVCLLDQDNKAEYDRLLKTAAAKHKQAAADVIPPPPAMSETSVATATVPVTDLAPVTDFDQWSAPAPVRPYAARKKKSGLSWGSAIAICLAGIVVVGVVVALSPKPEKSTDKSLPKPEPPTDKDWMKPVPNPTPTLPPITEPPPPVKPPIRLPVPSPQQIERAKENIHIFPGVPPQDILQEADKQEHPAMRYVLYLMVIDGAIEGHNKEIAHSAVERIIEQFDVDGDALRIEVEKRLRLAGQPPKQDDGPKVAPDEPASFPGIRLNSGRELTENDLKPVPPQENRASFTMRLIEDTAVFIHHDQKGSPNGLFTFGFKEHRKDKQDKKQITGPVKELTGPAIVIYPNGQLKARLNYAKNNRDGTLRYWEENGAPLLVSEFKNGKKLGMTCLCEKGQPILIEESDVGKRPIQYLIEIKGREAKAISREDADDEQRKRLDRAIDALHEVEKQAFSDEGEWKRSFGRWWDRNDEEIKRLKRALEKAEPKAAKEWQQKIDDFLKKIKTEGRADSNKVLDKLSNK